MNDTTKNIYCISGLGADETIFAHLHIAGYTLKYLPWIAPLPKESLPSYAARMAGAIPETLPVLIGVSFGGMMAIEMAKIIPVNKVIIISSVKCKAEMPLWMRLAGKLRINKIVPIKDYKFIEPYRNYRLGITTKEERELVNAYRSKADMHQIKWSIHQIVNWQSATYPDAIFHIHGEKDRMFPIRKLRPTHIIKGGTHMMIINRTKEISNCIQEILKT
jgi:pimeloyl-ACP methyl ester carboxylesterase